MQTRLDGSGERAEKPSRVGLLAALHRLDKALRARRIGSGSQKHLEGRARRLCSGPVGEMASRNLHAHNLRRETAASRRLDVEQDVRADHAEEQLGMHLVVKLSREDVHGVRPCLEYPTRTERVACLQQQHARVTLDEDGGQFGSLRG